MVTGIGMKELYQHLENSFVKCQPFLGVSTKQLQYHAIPTLTNESPKKKILHVGCYVACGIITRNILSKR